MYRVYSEPRMLQLEPYLEVGIDPSRGHHQSISIAIDIFNGDEDLDFFTMFEEELARLLPKDDTRKLVCVQFYRDHLVLIFQKLIRGQLDSYVETVSFAFHDICDSDFALRLDLLLDNSICYETYTAEIFQDYELVISWELGIPDADQIQVCDNNSLVVDLASGLITKPPAD